MITKRARPPTITKVVIRHSPFGLDGWRAGPRLPRQTSAPPSRSAEDHVTRGAPNGCGMPRTRKSGSASGAGPGSPSPEAHRPYLNTIQGYHVL